MQTTDPPVPPTSTATLVDRHARQRRGSHIITIMGMFLILLFFSPFVSCGDSTFTGAEAFQETIEIQIDMLDEGAYVSGPSLILFPLAGFIGIVLSLAALPRLSNGLSVRGYANTVVLVGLLTIWPIFDAVRVVTDSDGMYELEWGFYGSVAATVFMILAALQMRQEPPGAT